LSGGLLRQYTLGVDSFDAEGYPWPWSHTGGIYQPIKDVVREKAGHRCERCKHPYRKGEHASGEWSPCDEQCAHSGPIALIEPDVLHQTQELEGPVVPLSFIAHSVDVTTAREMKAVQERDLTILAHWRILTVHHLDEDKANCRWWNLVALCQRCHLRMQRAVVMDRPWLYEHSEWFKPYAAGFYAWKYLGEELEREETLSRLPELLALEHRFTQEAIF
jgi:hypothetical protein